MDIHSRDQRQITQNGGAWGALSPDDRFLFFNKAQEPGLWRLELSTGTETNLIATWPAADWGHWALGNDGIYTLARKGQEGISLNFCDFDGKNRVKLREFPFRLPGNQRLLSIDTQGQSAVLVQAKYRESDLRIVRNFH